MSLDEAARRWLEHCQPRVRARTREMYAATLRVLLDWCRDQGLGLDQLDQAVLDRWASHLQEPRPDGRLRSEETIRTYARIANLFLRWTARAHLTGELHAPAPRRRPRVVHVLSQDEIRRLEQAATHERDALLVRVLADTGIRAGELLALRVRDVLSERDTGSVPQLVVRGKGGSRLVGISPRLERRLRRLIVTRPTRPGPDDPVWVTLTRPIRPLTHRGLRNVLTTLAREAGLDRRVHAHLFRHTFATRWLNAGGDSLVLARALGHRSLAMVQQTYVHLAADEVAREMVRRQRS
ncbi:MAG TPA: tyrosine-type recombinase/integrase [Candidatus Dormibacteraeota bacterium]|nr:tyrosine-type recombinase/integrase [Candidatus Dormibacteraeota bacterium]